jgi:hypothetical protein
MHKGDRFLDYTGRVWMYERRDGALSGAHHVIAENGERSCFAGCAEGVIQ